MEQESDSRSRVNVGLKPRPQELSDSLYLRGDPHSPWQEEGSLGLAKRDRKRGAKLTGVNRMHWLPDVQEERAQAKAA